MKFDYSMHDQGGRLYGTTNTGHMLYFVFFSEKGLNPSIASPSLMFLASLANSGNYLSKSFQASPSAGCLSSFSQGCLFNKCHCASSDASFITNILFSLGANGKCRKTFYGIFFFSGSFHLERQQTGQLSRLAYFFLNDTQLLKQTCIESYPRPNSFRIPFASAYDLGKLLCSGNALDNSFNIAVNAELQILYKHFI